MKYEDFFSSGDVASFKRVTKGTMQLARVAREIACEMVNGNISTQGKEFVITEQGTFRLAMAENSDNTTEALINDQLGAIPIVMTDDEVMREFFQVHGVGSNAVWRFHERIHREMRSIDSQEGF